MQRETSIIVDLSPPSEEDPHRWNEEKEEVVVEDPLSRMQPPEFSISSFGSKRIYAMQPGNCPVTAVMEENESISSTPNDPTNRTV